LEKTADFGHPFSIRKNHGVGGEGADCRSKYSALRLRELTFDVGMKGGEGKEEGKKRKTPLVWNEKKRIAPVRSRHR